MREMPAVKVSFFYPLCGHEVKRGEIARREKLPSITGVWLPIVEVVSAFAGRKRCFDRPFFLPRRF